MIQLFSQQFFTFSQQNSLVHPDPPLFFPISVTTALTKTLTYPSILGGHTLNAVARFMSYPKL